MSTRSLLRKHVRQSLIKAHGSRVAALLLLVLVILAACAAPDTQDLGDQSRIRATVRVEQEILAAEIVVSFDAEKLEYLGHSGTTEAATVLTLQGNDEVWMGILAQQAVTGALVDLNFRILEAGGELSVDTITLSLPGGEQVLLSQEALEQVVVSGAIDSATSIIPATVQQVAPTQTADSTGIRLRADFANYSLGDVRRDGTIDFLDAVEVIYVMFGLTTGDYELYHSDVNGDGVVEFQDAVAILYKMLGIEYYSSRLMVFPREINLASGESQLVLLGDATSRDRITLRSAPSVPPGITVRGVSSSNAVGQAFEITSSGGSGQVSFDGGALGRASVGVSSGPSGGANVRFVMPTSGAVSQAYAGYNYYIGAGYAANRFHTGMDIAGARGTPVRAFTSGVVVFARQGFGNTVIIDHTSVLGRPVYSLYGHLDSMAVTEQSGMVQAGTIIGTMGSTGADAVHLHFEVRDFVTRCPTGNTGTCGYEFSLPSNFGYMDPIPMMFNSTSQNRTVTLRDRVNIRAMPSTRYGGAINTAAANERYQVIGSSRGDEADTSCDRGWYQIKPISSTSITQYISAGTYHFLDKTDTGYGGLPSMPTAWVCRGHAGEVWID